MNILDKNLEPLLLSFLCDMFEENDVKTRVRKTLFFLEHVELNAEDNVHDSVNEFIHSINDYLILPWDELVTALSVCDAPEVASELILKYDDLDERKRALVKTAIFVHRATEIMNERFG